MNGDHNNLQSLSRYTWQKRVDYSAIMMRFFMTTMRRAEALNEEGAGKNLSMYTMSISHADDFNFQLHNINIEVIGTALSLPGQGSDLDLGVQITQH